MSENKSWNWHGLMLKEMNLPPPACITQSSGISRPDMGDRKITNAEYMDSHEVLLVKAKLFADLLRKSKSTALFLGAGISTPNINDYASSSGSAVRAANVRLTHGFITSLRPTVAHKVLAKLVRDRLITHSPAPCLQQNHDGLLQKAGWPDLKICEIHGSWMVEEGNSYEWSLDEKLQPVVGKMKKKEDHEIIKMSGTLVDFKVQHMMDLEKQSDFCFSIGSSLSGLNADRIPRSNAERYVKKGKGLGTAILSLQQTEYDEISSLRIFAKCDDFMTYVASEMGIEPEWDIDYDYHTGKAKKMDTKLRTKQFVAAMALLEKLNRLKKGGTTSSSATSASGSSSSATSAATSSSSSAAVAVEEGHQQQVQKSQQPEQHRFSITVGNYHELEDPDDEKEQNRHRWTVFVRAPAGKVKSVLFKLHPTFSPSEVRVVHTQVTAQHPHDEEFCLGRLGWGTFDIGAEVTLNDGTVLKCSHTLSFSQPETSRVVFEK